MFMTATALENSPQSFDVKTVSQSRSPGSPTPDQNAYHASTHFREKGAFFQREAQIREIKKKGLFCRKESEKFKKKGKIWHVFITICLFRMFE